ncbi:hypothetical protein [uncultured Porticoccus sp.]|uniref:CAF17-like 4Fe-4S cluster assembly/insertion protein YgfZ n=1 Tax=uncultured Porticoccus sp. TaxID=1256050 RepID=UPI0030DB2B89
MNDWKRYLSTQGAVINDDQIHFHESPTDFQALLAEDVGIMSPLLHQGLISVTGPDAARFLQGQITSNALQLALGESTPGARCNAKGRMLASFVLFHAEDQHFLLQLHRSLVTPLINELTKYAVFFKVELTDVSDHYCLLGTAGKPVDKNSPTDTAYQYPLVDGRSILVIPAEKVPPVWKALRDALKPVGTELWQLMDIRSGLGHVEVDTVDLFIPQMLNFQAIGAISFKKGCYTGQEVVARMKYLGKLKRRMYRIRVPVSADRLLPGMPCYLQGQNQSVGNIVSTAHCDAERLEVLVVLTKEAADSDDLLIGSQQYPVVEKLSIPYEIL